MTKRPSDAPVEQLATDPPCDPAPPPTPTPTPTEEPQTRVLLTGDDRNVVTEEWIPTAAFGFRINVRGQFFEHVGEAVDSGTWIFAPTR